MYIGQSRAYRAYFSIKNTLFLEQVLYFPFQQFKNCTTVLSFLSELQVGNRCVCILVICFSIIFLLGAPTKSSLFVNKIWSKHPKKGLLGHFLVLLAGFYPKQGIWTLTPFWHFYQGFFYKHFNGRQARKAWLKSNRTSIKKFITIIHLNYFLTLSI